MTQTALSPAAQPVGAPRPVAADPAGAPAVAQPTPNRPVDTMSTPQRLRLLATALTAAGIVVGLVGALVFSFLAYSLSRAGSDTDQLIRVQKIQTNLLSADATATNAFLVGGLEPASQRATYDQAINDTSGLIAEAAQAQPADGAALAALNRQLTAYAATIEQARANNRQGLPVGAQYLRQASTQLRSGALPIMDNLVQANAVRAEDAMHLGLGYLFVAVAFLGLVATVVAHVWMARRFRRRINVGVATAAALMALAMIIGLVSVQQIGSAVDDIRRGSFAEVNRAAQVRIWANDAKSDESLTLIARGSGAAYEAAWASRAAQIDANVGQIDQRDVGQVWEAYRTAHRKIRTLDDGGSYDQAVALATGAAQGSANRTFTTLDSQLAGYVDSTGQATATALAARLPGLIVTAVLVLLAGLAAAALGRLGVGARLREYR